jgi:hypothetical protein
LPRRPLREWTCRSPLCSPFALVVMFIFIFQAAHLCAAAYPAPFRTRSGYCLGRFRQRKEAPTENPASGSPSGGVGPVLTRGPDGSPRGARRPRDILHPCGVRGKRQGASAHVLCVGRVTTLDLWGKHHKSESIRSGHTLTLRQEPLTAPAHISPIPDVYNKLAIQFCFGGCAALRFIGF